MINDKYILTVTLSGKQIVEQLAKSMAKSLGITVLEIQGVKVEVSDDFSGFLLYGADYSFIELTKGERIPLTIDHMNEALRICSSSIPSYYEIVGVGFPDQQACYNVTNKFNLIDFSVNVVLSRSPEVASEEDLIFFLHAILNCDTCDSGYFWGVGDYGHRLVARFFKMDRSDLLCDAISQYPDYDGRSSLIDLGWSLVRNHKQDLKACIAVASSIYRKNSKLTSPLVNETKAILNESNTISITSYGRDGNPAIDCDYAEGFFTQDEHFKFEVYFADRSSNNTYKNTRIAELYIKCDDSIQWSWYSGKEDEEPDWGFGKHLFINLLAGLELGVPNLIDR